MKNFKEFIAEKTKFAPKSGFKEKDLVKAIKKQTGRNKGILINLGNGFEVGIDMDTIKNKDGNSYFGLDRDAEEVEFKLSDIESINESLVEKKFNIKKADINTAGKSDLKALSKKGWVVIDSMDFIVTGDGFEVTLSKGPDKKHFSGKSAEEAIRSALKGLQ